MLICYILFFSYVQNLKNKINNFSGAHKMVVKVHQINSPARSIFDGTLCSVPISARREGPFVCPMLQPNKQHDAGDMLLDTQTLFWEIKSDTEHRVNISNLSEPSWWITFRFLVWICYTVTHLFLVLISTTELCNHPESITNPGAGTHFFLVPPLKEYKVLLPGSISCNSSLCGFKE